ncbi:MAG TPA: hypothetical protein VMU28_14005 [Terriglobales bacterium]|nr:hypothetical protein [Terriglobales bacterium]
MRLDDFVLYLDENLNRCKPILAALETHHVRYELHEAHFPRGTDDDEWLPFVAQRFWIVLTKDKRNRYNELERKAVQRFAVKEFYFASGNFNGHEMAAALISAISKMKQICSTEEPPFVGSIARGGEITIVYDKHGSTHERRKKEREKAKSTNAS